MEKFNLMVFGGMAVSVLIALGHVLMKFSENGFSDIKEALWDSKVTLFFCSASLLVCLAFYIRINKAVEDLGTTSREIRGF